MKKKIFIFLLLIPILSNAQPPHIVTRGTPTQPSYEVSHNTGKGRINIIGVVKLDTVINGNKKQPITENKKTRTNIFQNTHFEGNQIPNPVVPADNSIAVSNFVANNYVISVAIHSVNVYQTDGTLIYTKDLEDIYPTSGFIVSDPQIIWDSDKEVFYLSYVYYDFSNKKSRVRILGGPSSNVSTWILGEFDGDLDLDGISDNSWSDYPRIGISKNEVYITTELYDY